MADKRKLQGEIDRCLKKIQEGIEAFDDIWKKAHSTNNANQKEKFEADLKKEIKKLQRLRDQIKTWVVSADIKDKETLVDHRKKIEAKMEQFKVIERETKTKAYSKEGLLGATGKVDPKEKEKEDIVNWLQQDIANLNEQSDRIEADVEALTSSNRKKKLDKDDQLRHEGFKDRLSKNRFHINKLEAILRKVDNAAVQFEQIQKIRDDVEYYIESIDDPDYEENDSIYAELDLDDIASLQSELLASSPSESDIDLQSSGGVATTTSSNHSESPSPLSVAPSTVAHSKSIPAGNKNNNLMLKINNPVNSSSTGTISSGAKVPPTPTKLNNPGTPSTPGVDNTTRPPLVSTLGYAQVASSNHGAALNRNAVPASPKIQMTSSSSSGVNGLISSPASLLSQSVAAALGSSSSHPPPPPPPPSSSSIVLPSSTSLPIPIDLSNSSSAFVSGAGTSQALSSTAASTAPTVSAGVPSVVPQMPTDTSQFLEQQQQMYNQQQFQQMMQLQMQLSQQQRVVAQQQQQQADTAAAASAASVETKKLLNGMVNAGATGNPTIQMETNTLASLKSLAHNVMNRSDADTSQIQAMQQSALSDANSTLTEMTTNGTVDAKQLPGSGMPITAEQQQQQLQHQLQQQQQQQQLNVLPMQMIHMSPLLGVAPLGPQPLSIDHTRRQTMLASAFLHIPIPCDSEKIRVYFPSNPCPTPSYYPQSSPSALNAHDFFSKLEPDSLFFMFYYMEGTKAQYLAAKALKQKSWRFHTKYMMWFQRHEEPKTITEEFEQGTYIYFDYEKWGQRKKEGFRFEYKFLEDQELV